MKIVTVIYEDKQYPGTYYGREYSYYTSLHLEPGDIVIAPTANGDSMAMIERINVDESEIPAHILPLLKTIERFADGGV